MKCVILQPTYLPWIGYFAMIDLTDTFIFYDDVQFVKQSWQQRNKIRQNENNWLWLTVPVIQKFGQKINETLIDNKSYWNKKHIKSIQAVYSQAQYFNSFIGEISNILLKNWEYLCDLDISIITKICKMLDINIPKFIKSSDLSGIDGQKTDRVISILKKIGADEYISGPAAKDYIDIKEFDQHNIKLYWFNYEHPIYPQSCSKFMPYLSIVDLIMNTGDSSIKYIRNNLENAIVEANGGI